MWTATRLWGGVTLVAFGMWMGACPSSAADDNSVSGVFKGNGKEAKLAFVSARKGEPFADKPTIILVFTEKDHSKEKMPDFKAGFGAFGSALIVTVNPEGKIVGCLVAHTALKKGPINSIGTVTMSDFKLEGGKIQGKLATKGEEKSFGETWEFDIKFQTKTP
jgi:hypothetical protein